MSRLKKNGKTVEPTTLPGLPPGAPTGSFPLTPDETAEIRAINSTNRLLQAEAEKVQLQQNNLFLRIQIRTGQDMTGWGVDLQRGIAVPPGAAPPLAPPVPPTPAASAPKADEKPAAN